MNLLLSTDNWEQSCDDFCTKWADLFLTPNDIASFKHMIGFHAHLSDLLEDINKLSFFQGTMYMYEQYASLRDMKKSCAVAILVNPQQIKHDGLDRHCRGV